VLTSTTLPACIGNTCRSFAVDRASAAAGHVNALKTRERHKIGLRWDHEYGPNYRFRALFLNFVAVTEVSRPRAVCRAPRASARIACRTRSVKNTAVDGLAAVKGTKDAPADALRRSLETRIS